MTFDKMLWAGLVPLSMLATPTATFAAEAPPPIILAQQKNEPPLTEEEKKRRERLKQQQQQQQPQQPPPQKQTAPQPRSNQPPTLQKQPSNAPQQPATTTPPVPPTTKQAITPQKPPQPDVVAPKTPATPPTLNSNKLPPPPPTTTTQTPPKPVDKTIVAPKAPVTTPTPATSTTTTPPKTATPPVTTAPPATSTQPATKDANAPKPPSLPAVVPPTTQQTSVPVEKRTLTAPPPPKLEAIQKNREQRTEDGGKRLIVQEPNGRIIVKQDNRAIIQHNDAERFVRLPNAQTNKRNDGITETFYVRPDGVRVVTEVDGRGQLVRRFRRAPDGREFTIIDNRRFIRNAVIGVGITALAVAVAVNLPPPRVTIPRERYIVEYDRATPDDIYEALSAPPLERLERAYSLEEVRYSHALRERMRRIDLDGITFDSGSAEIAPEQFAKLERLARQILRVLERNPEEVFLVEGHTDAVGSDIDNLSLSDRRAEAVAQVLTDVFQVPPENLVTQGYGEQFLKIPTQDAERLNRRVALRRIGPLLAERQ